MAAAFAVPILGLIVQAFADEWRAPALIPQRLGLRGFRYAFSTGDALTALTNSLVIAIAATVISLLLGWPAARALAEARLRRPAPVFLLLALPLLVPALATGTGLTEWFIRLGLVDTRLGIVLAHLTVVLPYVLLVLIGAFGQRLTELEEMATVMGWSPVRRLIVVSIPAARATLATAAVLGFLVSWSQYGTSLAVGGGVPTLPIVLLPYVSSDPEVAAALAMLFLAPAVVALVAATRSARSGL
ncbi:MAG: ABC transporter permease [Solirubrobacterales bacterium]